MMLRIKACLLMIIMGLIGFTLSAEDGETRTATLPLDDILRLYREIDQLKEPVEKKLPVKATIQRIDLDGQLLEDAIDVQATIQVIVLADEEWAEVPLLEVDSDTHISVLPDIPGAVLVLMNNTLSLLTETEGTYTFTVSFLKNAVSEGSKKTIRLILKNTSQSILKLRFDSNYIALKEHNIQIVTSDGVFIYPHDNQYQLQWENKRITANPAAISMASKAEIESVIKTAHASLISTLEGKMIYRILYKLHFTGEKTISFFIPELYTLEKVYLNKIQHSFNQKDNVFTTRVNPGRSGGQSGEIELIISHQQGNYLLSGTINAVLPRTTWPIHEMYLTTYLPDVFDYAYRGGSLKLVDTTPDIDYTYQIPLPGEKLHFHQYLISASHPSISLDYTINLDGNYFLVFGRYN